MTLSRIRRAGFDTETTGPDPLTARIVTAALVFIGGGKPDQAFTWLLNPGVDIPDEAAKVHGITTAMAKTEGQDPAVALADLAEKLHSTLAYGMPLIAYNAAFDWTVLDGDLRRYGLPAMADRLCGEPLRLLDPYVIDKAVDKYRKGSRKLQPTCEHYGVALTDWHTAEADAMAAVLVMDQIAERNPRLADLAPAELFAQQRKWAAGQAAGLQEYFRRKDPNAVVDGSWPLRAGGAR